LNRSFYGPSFPQGPNWKRAPSSTVPVARQIALNGPSADETRVRCTQ
jgi:hypothetical protein